MISLIVASSAMAVSPAMLWQNVEAGMTLDRLKAARPHIHTPSADEMTHQMEDCAWTDEPVTVREVRFTVCYVLPRGAVTMVRMDSELKYSTALVSLIKLDLAAKYGAPLSENCTGDWLKECRAVWRFGNIGINQRIVHIDDESSTDIEYQVVNEGESGKL